MPTTSCGMLPHSGAPRRLLWTRTVDCSFCGEKTLVSARRGTIQHSLREQYPWRRWEVNTECREHDRRDSCRKVIQCKTKISAEAAAIAATKEQKWRRTIHRKLGQS